MKSHVGWKKKQHHDNSTQDTLQFLEAVITAAYKCVRMHACMFNRPTTQLLGFKIRTKKIPKGRHPKANTMRKRANFSRRNKKCREKYHCVTLSLEALRSSGIWVLCFFAVLRFYMHLFHETGTLWNELTLLIITMAAE